MTRAVVVGAGIAGTVAAIALHKAGIETTVFEAYPKQDEEIGAFITLATNGFDGLNAIDLADPVRAASFSSGTIELLRSDGTRVGGFPGRSRTITRSSLHHLLHQAAAQRGIHIEYDTRLVDARETDDGTVTATFSDGGQATADVLIGADGVRSVIRRLIDPDAPEPRYAGLHIVCGYTSRPSPAAPDGYRMISGERGFFGYTTAPDGRNWWFARVPALELDGPAFAGMSSAAWLTRMTEVFDAETVAGQVVRATDEVIGYQPRDIPALASWHTRSMVVIGDAAHAASPAAAQGASMAIEDGVTLAQCLRDLPAPAAFRAYEHLRRTRVERVVASGAQRGPSGPPQKQPGNTPSHWRGAPDVSWLYDHHIDWDNQINSPSAEAVSQLGQV